MQPATRAALLVQLIEISARDNAGKHVPQANITVRLHLNVKLAPLNVMGALVAPT